jgi:membrane protein YqaA with SNARE-associated domain
LHALKWPAASSWVKATLPALGGAGVFLAAFLGSSFVPLPLVTDLIVMELSIRQPLRMQYYAAMAALGSLAGCIWIYALARKAGEAYYRRKQGHPRDGCAGGSSNIRLLRCCCPPSRLFLFHSNHS